MGLCNKLNCCNQQKNEKANEPPDDDAAIGDGSKKSPGERQQSMNGHLENGEAARKQEPPVYAAVQKRQSKLVSPPTSPIKAEFLVSFVVDCRGGAMTGCRGSGLRLILPAGAVDQPCRVTCRFVRPHSHGAQFPFFPPPLMERDALASGVIEVGPSGANFKLPVLVEIPYFASLRGGQRELVVLRSDDGETWREHDEAVFLGSSGWGSGEEGQIYQDVVNSVDLKRAAEDLETPRIVRLSTTTFPRYFVLLSRVQTEVKTISPEGGFVEAWLQREDNHANEGEPVRVRFPADSLKKKIKIGLQLQRIPEAALEMICNDGDGVIVEAFPLIGIYPRRRKFHRPIEVSVPLSLSASSSSSSSRIGSHDVSSHIRLLCSLSSSSEKTVIWEDVSSSAGVSLIDGRLVFQTRVSALFWLVTCSKGGIGNEDNNSGGGGLINLASALYRELAVSPYVARLTVLYRRQFPFAWCDALRIYLGVGDRMDGHLLQQQQLKDWRKVLDGVEVEVGERCAYYFEMKDGDFVLAADCQSEAKLDDRLVFRAFRENSMTLLVKTRTHGTLVGGRCCLVMKRQTGLGGPASKSTCRSTASLFWIWETTRAPPLTMARRGPRWPRLRVTMAAQMIRPVSMRQSKLRRRK